ncbi:hypothetical protein NRK67_16545 (plasmid) [Fusobacteria bacterium ZRK30]|nr:hypothetical protein NRK67_16545 [Fusobacteria bacterium ZRK30]
MEITEEILTIKEVFEIIRNGFGLGELAELHMENKNEKEPGLISGNIRKNNNSLATTEKLENLVENLIDNYIDPLIELISNEDIIEEYRNQLTKFFKNFDENIIFLNSFCPIKDLQKDVLLYLISSEGLKIYYEIKINDKYDPKPKKGSDYTQYNEIPKSLKTLIEEKNNKMSKLFDRKASNYLKDNGASMGSRTIVDTKNTTLENTMEGIEEFFVECFFKRVQWGAYNKLGKIKGLREVMDAFPNIIKRLLNFDKEMSEEEFMKKWIQVVVEETAKAAGISNENNIKEVQTELNKGVKLYKKNIEDINNNPENIMEFIKPMKSFFNPLELKDKISLKKLKKDCFHGYLMDIHKEYNELKRDYSIESHKNIYKNKIKEHKNSGNRYYKSYFNYFINDSICLIEKNIENFKGPDKQKLENFKQKFKNVSLYRDSNNNWNEKEIDYLDIYLETLLIDKQNKDEILGDFSLEFIEIMKFFKEFSTEEAFESLKKDFEQWEKNIEQLVIS